MDLFIYQAAVKELYLCKISSKLEELARIYTGKIKKLPIGNTWDESLYPIPYTEQILWYKLLTLTLKLHSSKSKKVLPDFIHTTKSMAHSTLLNAILGFDQQREYYKKWFPLTELINYEQLLDWFEFDTILNLPQSINFVENLNTIVGNNSIPFSIEFNNSLTVFDSYSTKFPKQVQQLVYAIRYKQTNFPDKPQTIWDLFLECIRKQAYDISQEEADREVLKLEQQITAIKSFKDFYGK